MIFCQALVPLTSKQITAVYERFKLVDDPQQELTAALAERASSTMKSLQQMAALSRRAATTMQDLQVSAETAKTYKQKLKAWTKFCQLYNGGDETVTRE